MRRPSAISTQTLVGVEIDLRAAGAVERLGEDAGGGGLAGAARPDEEIGVGEAVLRDGIAQRPHDVVLSEDVVERLRAVLAGEDLVAHRRAGRLKSTRRRERAIFGRGAAATHVAHSGRRRPWECDDDRRPRQRAWLRGGCRCWRERGRGAWALGGEL